MFGWVKELCSGFLIGAVNIIPGVSGGTVLFLIGLYERTMGALSKIKADSVKALLRGAWGTLFSNQRRDSLKQLNEQAEATDILFLIRLVSGAGLAIILLSGVMKHLLEKQFSNTYAFFLGLIAVSTVMTLKMLTVKKPVLIIHFIIGTAITVALTASVDPSIKAMEKSARYEKMYTESTASSAGSSAISSSTPSTELTESTSANPGKSTNTSARLKYTGVYTIKEIAVASAAGAVAICIMILPGLSGSLVLILLGQYHEIISAVSNLKTLQLDYFVFLTMVSLGMLIGILAFARFVNFVFKRYYNGTVALMIGLTAGSLYALWPFKKAVVTDQYVKGAGGAITVIKDAVIQTNVNILPDEWAPAITALLLCGLGIALMVVLDRLGVKKDKV